MSTPHEMFQNHVIIAGFSNFGRTVANRLSLSKTPVIVIDRNETKREEARRRGFEVIDGLESDDEVLISAGVFRASHLVISSLDAEVALVCCLSARTLSPTLNIICRAQHESLIGKFQRAGASQTIVPERSAGQEAFNAIRNPRVADLLQRSSRPEENIALAEIRIEENSRLVGRSLKDYGSKEATAVSYVALEREGEATHFPPKGAEIMRANDLLVVWGSPEQVQMMHEAAIGRPDQDAPPAPTLLESLIPPVAAKNEPSDAAASLDHPSSLTPSN
ncbi:MAG: TrkA family potassium uptake protein [Planctomycetota bacterium]